MPATLGLANIDQRLSFSLAATIGTRGVAVILSGAGYDGSDALEAIKAAGGTTFAQSDAAFASMPRHAIATGHVDLILSAAEIGNHLSVMGIN
jgi:two-component system CheB/CheR fusion protein